MKVEVKQETCIGCGLCMNVCPKVFGLSGEGKSEVICDAVPSDSENDVKQCIDMCPVGAISEDN